MHRIDGLDHVSNLFDEGDPMVPREATQVTHQWLNAVQEEICNVIEGAGITLDNSSETARNQLLAAIDKLNPVKAAGTIITDGSGGATIAAGARNIASLTMVPAGGNRPQRVRVTFNEPVNILSVNIGVMYAPATGILTIDPRVYINNPTSNSFEFFIRDDNGSSNVTNAPLHFFVTVIGS